MTTMRTAAEYRASVADGRRVWYQGRVLEDLAAEPITKGLVDSYARWYDWHSDPEWNDTLWVDGPEGRQPLSFVAPKDVGTLRKLANSIRLVAQQDAGTLSHTPGYGALIMLGVSDVLASYGESGAAATAEKYYRSMAADGRFVTGVYAPAQTDRFRPPEERLAVQVVEERDDGIVVDGALAIGTSLAYSDEVFSAPIPYPGMPVSQAVWFAFAVNAPGVEMVLRKPASLDQDPFSFPLSSRFDEHESALILRKVFVPWDRVFAYRAPETCLYLTRAMGWLLLSHLARMLARYEFSLGLGLTVTSSLKTSKIPGVTEVLTDLAIQTETLRTALSASVADAVLSPAGNLLPDLSHLAVGTLQGLSGEATVAKTVRTLAGQGVMMAPTQQDLDAGDLQPYIEKLFGGGELSAHERSALFHLITDHTASATEGRVAAFSSLSTGGELLWRRRLRWAFKQAGHDNACADLVTKVLRDSTGVDLDIRADFAADDPRIPGY
jgi:aromatic ring hydroxylase